MIVSCNMSGSEYQSKINDLHARGWDDESGAYTPWGQLVVSYFYTTREKRIEYLRFLLGIKLNDPSDEYAHEHISAIMQAMDLDTYEKKYGGYGAIFLGRINVYESSTRTVFDEDNMPSILEI